MQVVGLKANLVSCIDVTERERIAWRIQFVGNGKVIIEADLQKCQQKVIRSSKQF